LQPRFSFNYALDDDTQIRGGAGLFISNTPAVWVANPYSNNGVAVASYDVNRRRLATDPVFSADPLNQNVPGGTRTLPGLGTSQMTVSVVDPDFELPAVTKWTLGVDHELPWLGGVIASAEYQHIDVYNGIKYDNLNLGDATGSLPDGRLSYARFPNAAPGGTNTNRWDANPSFSQQIILLTNTDKGKSDNLTLSLRKPFSNNWGAMLAYTHSTATDVNPGTSSVANSSFQNRDWINPNDDYNATSNYEIPNRVLAQVTWQHNFFGEYATTFSAFYDGHNGAPYSWIFGNDVNGDSYFRDLAYVPAGPGDVRWTTATLASPGLVDSFWEYVNSNPELARHKGEIFPRNDARAPWVNQLDVSFTQEVPGFMKGHKGEIRFDIFNFLNLLNKDWGVERRAAFPLERVLANSAGVVDGQYVYDLVPYRGADGTYSPAVLQPNESFNPSQRWSVLMTLRYKF
jgi:hypothetical protein